MATAPFLMLLVAAAPTLAAAPVDAMAAPGVPRAQPVSAVVAAAPVATDTAQDVAATTIVKRPARLPRTPLIVALARPTIEPETPPLPPPRGQPRAAQAP